MTGRRLGTVARNYQITYNSAGFMSGTNSFPTCVKLSAILGLVQGVTHRLMSNPKNDAATENYFYVKDHPTACPGQCLKYSIRFDPGKTKFRITGCILDIDVLCDPIKNPITNQIRCYDCP